MMKFTEFGLSERLIHTLDAIGFTEATPIQEAAIPLALKGRDILGSAQTGTGKTGAFSIPMIEYLYQNTEKTAIVLTPTRELAKQVLDNIHAMSSKKAKLNTAFIIGGEPYGKQFAQLRNNPRIIVGTPGRINDHLDKGAIDLSQCGFLVLDETDRMLDMGFGVQLDRIKKHLPEERQTLLFSATMPDNIMSLAKKYLNNPERISMGNTNIVAPKIKTEIVRIAHEKKHDEMVRQLQTREGTVIIFVKTKYGTEKMAKRLREDGFTADALHGDLRQRKRDQVMQAFRNKKFRILCATDIAARGLDVPHIEHVINHDLPQVAEDYIHRMGRTARAGAEGSALCFISPSDYGKWREIEKLLGIKSNDNEGGNGRRNHRGAGAGQGKKKPFAKKPRWSKEGKPKDGKPAFKGKRTDKRTDFSKKRKAG
jgi:superfamily II DNA/RNA helicase